MSPLRCFLCFTAAKLAHLTSEATNTGEGSMAIVDESPVVCSA